MPDPKPEVVTAVVDGRRLQLSNLDKVLYPATETTKGEVLNYYARVAPFLLPHLADRPVTRIRWPHGTGGPSFFEKNLPAGAPSWLHFVTVPTSGSRSQSGNDTIRYPVVRDTADLTYLANLASLELHVPQWRFDADGAPRHPDRLVIDLDPGAPAGLHECAMLALLVRERLDHIGLPAAPVTSGSKGMQLYAALPGEQDSDSIRDIDRPGPDPGAARAGRVEDDEVSAPGQGAPGLEPERGGQDHHHALLAAWQAGPVRRSPPHLAGDRTRRREAGRPKTAGHGRRAGPDLRARRRFRRGPHPANLERCTVRDIRPGTVRTSTVG